MNYVDIRCIQRVWTTYKQIHMYVPAFNWVIGEAKHRKYEYWTLVPSKLWCNVQKQHIFKPFLNLVDVVYIYDYVLVDMHGFVDKLKDMDDLLVSGAQMMRPLNNSYAITMNKSQLHSIIHIGECNNYWEVPISSITFNEDMCNFNITRKKSLGNSSCIHSDSVMIGRRLGKELWDKLAKWVCVDLVADPNTPAPIKMGYSNSYLDNDFIYTMLGQGDAPVDVKFLEKWSTAVDEFNETKVEFFKQFGMSNKLEWRNR